MQLGLPAAVAAEFQNQAGDRIFFGESSSALGARARAALDAQAAWLVQHPTLQVTVEGHADDAGGADGNLEVSQRRADVVRRRLIERGVAGERISTMAYGKTRPIASCSDSMCTAQNRRAITVLVPLSQGSSGRP
jgi:peptidoglycan-associated lipoprotein